MSHWKIVCAAIIVAVAVNASFADAIKPAALSGWQVWGPEGDKYEVGIDPAESSPEHPALVIASKSKPTEEVLALSQDIDATGWHGKIIEFSLMARAVGAKKNKVWLRYLAAPNFIWGEEKVIPDGKGWEKITLRGYFPPTVDMQYANHFDIGFGLGSTGKIWIKDVKLEKIETTPLAEQFDMPPFRSGLPVYPPRNLNFTASE